MTRHRIGQGNILYLGNRFGEGACRQGGRDTGDHSVKADESGKEQAEAKL